jgi:hypothetical protein
MGTAQGEDSLKTFAARMRLKPLTCAPTSEDP